jgi:hypothetical protein
VLKAESYELHKRLNDMVSRCTPQLQERPGVGPDSAAALLITADDNPDGSAAKAPTRPCAASARSKPPLATPSDGGSTVAATGKPTPLSIGSPCPGFAGTNAPRTTCNAAWATARRTGKRSDASSATSPARSSHCYPPRHDGRALDIHRGIGLTGLPDAINVTWPQAVMQLCVVQPDPRVAAVCLPPEVRKVIYTTNPIGESMNARLRKVTRNRGQFPSGQAALKVLYLAVRNLEEFRGAVATWESAAPDVTIKVEIDGPSLA